MPVINEANGYLECPVAITPPILNPRWFANAFRTSEIGGTPAFDHKRPPFAVIGPDGKTVKAKV
jgi:hypothetical protein